MGVKCQAWLSCCDRRVPTVGWLSLVEGDWLLFCELANIPFAVACAHQIHTNSLLRQCPVVQPRRVYFHHSNLFPWELKIVLEASVTLPRRSLV